MTDAAQIMSRYADVRAKLYPTRRAAVVLSDRDPKRSHDPYHYRKAIGPQRVVFDLGAPICVPPMLVYRPPEKMLVAPRLNALASAKPFVRSSFAAGVEAVTGMPWRDIVSEYRAKEYVRVRAMVLHALRNAGWSYPAIGRLFNRDHTTIIYMERNWTPEGERARPYGQGLR